MDKRWLILVGVLVVVGILFFGYNRAEPRAKICFDEICINAEIVDAPESRALGLMFREELGENEGMFFVFDKVGHYPFWMKNTLIPLDIIWLDSDYKIVHIAQAEPCEKDPCVVYDPVVDSLYVVEVNKGFSEEHGIEVGESLRIRI